MQFLNGWGETLANIDARTQSQRPSGEFAVCLEGATVALPADTVRVDVPATFLRVLARVELGDNWKDAVALQKKFALRSTGTPTPPTLPDPGVRSTASAPRLGAPVGGRVLR